jgi:hypothetical protein
LQPAQSRGAAADGCAEAVHRPVDTAVVEVDQCAREPLSRTHEHLFVERIGIQLVPGRDGDRRTDWLDDWDGAEGNERPGDTEHDDKQGDDREHDRRHRVHALFDPGADRWGEPVRHPTAEDEQVTTDQSQRAEHDQRRGHRHRRLVRVHVVLPALLAEEGHD